MMKHRYLGPKLSGSSYISCIFCQSKLEIYTDNVAYDLTMTQNSRDFSILTCKKFDRMRQAL